MTNIYDMIDISRTYQEFNSKFIALKSLPINTKLCVDQDTLILYIDTNPTLFGIQSAIRRARNQTRDNLNVYLCSQFDEYTLFMNMIKDAYVQIDISANINNNNEYDILLELIKNMISFNVDITTGLQNTSTLYPDHPIQNTIDTILKSLLQYDKIYKQCLKLPQSLVNK